MDDSDALEFSIHEASAAMAGVDPMDIDLRIIANSLKLRIAPHPDANVKPEAVDEFRRCFHFLLAVSTTLELKLKNYKSHDLEKTMKLIIDAEYQAYLARVNNSAAPAIEEISVRYSLEPEFSVIVRRHLERFYREKAMTAEEAQRFQRTNVFAYRYVCGEYQDVYLEESDIRAILQKYNFNDKYFNLAPSEPETATLSDTDDSKGQLIQWTGGSSDFACIIALLLEKKYIRAKDLTEALRIAVKHFSGVDSNLHTLSTLAGKRRSNSTWFKDTRSFPEAVPPTKPKKNQPID